MISPCTRPASAPLPLGLISSTASPLGAPPLLSGLRHDAHTEGFDLGLLRQVVRRKLRLGFLLKLGKLDLQDFAFSSAFDRDRHRRPGGCRGDLPRQIAAILYVLTGDVDDDVAAADAGRLGRAARSGNGDQRAFGIFEPEAIGEFRRNGLNLDAKPGASSHGPST